MVLGMLKVYDTRARNLNKLSSKFLHSFVDEQYPSNMTSGHNHRNLRKNIRKFIAHVSPVLDANVCGVSKELITYTLFPKSLFISELIDYYV